MATNWRGVVAELLRETPWAQSEWGAKLTGFVGLRFDGLAQAVTEAVICPWLLEETSPDDILPMLGRERNMPRYPAETTARHRTRLHGAWDAWEYAGSEIGILGQFTELGLAATLYTEAEWERGPLWQGQLWKSQFWILLDANQGFSAPLVCGAGALAGDGSICGLSYDETLGSATDVVAAIRYIVKKWKAAPEICREVIASSGEICGDGSLADDGSICGGFAATISTF
jgi:hypothetical protein